jgi:hypothetical protein
MIELKKVYMHTECPKHVGFNVEMQSVCFLFSRHLENVFLGDAKEIFLTVFEKEIPDHNVHLIRKNTYQIYVWPYSIEKIYLGKEKERKRKVGFDLLLQGCKKAAMYFNTEMRIFDNTVQAAEKFNLVNEYYAGDVAKSRWNQHSCRNKIIHDLDDVRFVLEVYDNMGQIVNTVCWREFKIECTRTEMPHKLPKPVWMPDGKCVKVMDDMIIEVL